MSLPPEIEQLLTEMDANTRDARAIADGLDEARGTWRPAPGSWSVAECFDHLALSNRVYLAAIKGAADRARAKGRLRRRPAKPGPIGAWFVRTMEPPVTRKLRNPRQSTPRSSPPLTASLAAFLASQDEVRAFMRSSADLDLASIHFPNPFVRWIRFSLATGLHVIPAHERRHLWQAQAVLTAAPPAG